MNIIIDNVTKGFKLYIAPSKGVASVVQGSRGVEEKCFKEIEEPLVEKC